ncbi:MAG: ABC transporter ATP-binding protein [Streptococcus salivarius]
MTGFYDRQGAEIFDGTVSQLKRPGKMKTLSFDLTPGQNHLVSHYEGLPDMSIDRQGNTLNIEFDSSRYQSADIIKQTLSDFEIRDLKMVDTDIEDIIRRFYRKEL